MPNPEGSDLHIDRALTGISVGYFQDPNDFIADKVFPSYPVDFKSDYFNKYSKSDFRRSRAQKRAPGTESAATSWEITRDRYFAEVYALHHDIADQDRGNADAEWDENADATLQLTNDILIMKDQLWASKFFGTGIWETDKVGGTDFDPWDTSGSDPLANATQFLSDGRKSIGRKFNIAVCGADTWVALENHPAILDRIKYTEKGVVDEDLVAQFFKVQKFLVAHSTDSSGDDIPDAKAQDAAADYNWILDSKSIGFFYAPPKVGKRQPAAGYTFNWRGYGAKEKSGLTIKNFRLEAIASDRIEVECAFDMKQVSPDCGIFLHNAVS